MQIQLYGGPSTLTIPPIGRQVPYSVLVAETQLTVGAAAIVNVVTPIAGFSYLVTVRNSSPAAQQIRIGSVPSFAPVTGVLLLAGDSYVLEDLSFTLNVISNGAGGLLDVFILRSATV